MTLAETLLSAWNQVLVEKRGQVELEGELYPAEETRSRKLRTVDFKYQGHRITGIEQNPETSSRWAELARQGKRVMQFSSGGKYIGNVCEGQLTRYPAWQALGLPD